MPVLSGGQVKMATQTTFEGGIDSAFAYSGAGPHPLGNFLGNAMAYDRIYETQLYPAVAVNKLTALHVALPGKTYERKEKGREDARRSPFGQLMARPSRSINPVHFWSWYIAMYWIHGRSFLRKIRDRGGRPAELSHIHPTRMRYGPANGGYVTPGIGAETSEYRWWIRNDNGTEVHIPREDLVYWPRFSPKHPQLGMSPFEPLRDTLANEAGARRANLAQWQRGGKPSFVLSYPKRFKKKGTAARVANNFQQYHGGVDNWGAPLVLQEGMEAKALGVEEDLQYVEVRKLNRGEVASAFDMPPPAMQILDDATFSNITEQMRMLYRQTMAAPLQSFEAVIEFDLRDGSFGEGPPDFADVFYFESLVDGVMRGSFEDRVKAYAQAINSAQITPAEVRDLENRPYIDGTNVLFINQAATPVLTAAGHDDPKVDPKEVAALVQKLYLGTEGKTLLSTTEARQIVNLAGAGLTGAGPGAANSSLAALEAAEPLANEDQSKVMGRLSRPTSLDEIDADALVDDLDDIAADAVRGALAIAIYGECSVAELRSLIKKIGV